MMPTPGRYRFTCTKQPPTVPPEITVVEYGVYPDGVRTGTFGTLPYEAAGDVFRRGTIAMKCLGYDPATGTGSGIGFNGAEEYVFTCVRLGPNPP